MRLYRCSSLSLWARQQRVCWSSSVFKGVLHHLLCVHAALVKSTKAIWLHIISSIDQQSFLYLLIIYIFQYCTDQLCVQYISCIPNSIQLTINNERFLEKENNCELLAELLRLNLTLTASAATSLLLMNSGIHAACGEQITGEMLCWLNSCWQAGLRCECYLYRCRVCEFQLRERF